MTIKKKQWHKKKKNYQSKNRIINKNKQQQKNKINNNIFKNVHIECIEFPIHITWSELAHQICNIIKRIKKRIEGNQTIKLYQVI